MCLKMPLDGDAHYEGSDINVNAASNIFTALVIHLNYKEETFK